MFFNLSHSSRQLTHSIHLPDTSCRKEAKRLEERQKEEEEIHQKYAAKITNDVNDHTTKVAEETIVKMTDAIETKGSEVKDAIEQQGKETKEGFSQIETSIEVMKNILLESAKKEMRRVEQSEIVPTCISLDKRFASTDSTTAASTEATEELEKYSLANLRNLKRLTLSRFSKTK